MVRPGILVRTRERREKSEREDGDHLSQHTAETRHSVTQDPGSELRENSAGPPHDGADRWAPQTPER